MGKSDAETGVVTISNGVTDNVDANRNHGRSERCERLWKRCGVSLKCVVVVVFSVAVLLSALFLLPVFRGKESGDLGFEELFKGHSVVASFKLQKSESSLSTNIRQLEIDLYDELALPDSTVSVIALHPLAVPNLTNVVFAIVPSTSPRISQASLSLLRASFMELVTRQSSLKLSSSLFGEPFSFEVLKFDGGITVIPQQKAFLLQKVQIFFNFTLNYSIHQVQENFAELRNQLKSGLHLSSYENLYIGLNNSYGSTLAPPTTVQASILLTIGNHPPSKPRLKQLAETIADSPTKNLGLNNTVFGKVKSVRLSSVLQHSLNSGWSPTPAPLPEPNHQHHHHHHHHHYQDPHHSHHHQHYAPAPAPGDNLKGNSPLPSPSPSLSPSSPGRRMKSHGKANNHARLAPEIAPVVSPSPVSTLAPSPHVAPESQFPSVAPSVAPWPASSCYIPRIQWSISLLLPLIAQL